MSTRDHRCEVPFDGKVILFSGDFRQTLPVIPLGNEPTIVGSRFLFKNEYDFSLPTHINF